MLASDGVDRVDVDRVLGRGIGEVDYAAERLGSDRKREDATYLLGDSGRVRVDAGREEVLYRFLVACDQRVEN